MSILLQDPSKSPDIVASAISQAIDGTVSPSSLKIFSEVSSNKEGYVSVKLSDAFVLQQAVSRSNMQPHPPSQSRSKQNIQVGPFSSPNEGTYWL
jgi:hypothetical protein